MSAPSGSASSPSLRTLFRSQAGHLALAVLVVELLVGMQIYLNQTVPPLLAAEVGVRNAYGLVAAAAQVPAFLTMPLGGAMLARWRPNRLMTALTVLLLLGAIVGALTPNVWVCALGEILRGLVAGALATATMGVMVVGLPDAWGQLRLAAGLGMWVVAVLAGPVYASDVDASWGWRWFLVLCLPMLIATRAVMTGQIRDLRLDEETNHDETVPWPPILAMAAGVALIGALRTSGPWFWPDAGVSTVLAFWSYSCVLPDGILCLVPGRRADIVTLLWVCAFFLTLDYLAAPNAHNVLSLAPIQTGRALTAGGIDRLAIAITHGARPARELWAYQRRIILAAVFFVAGMMLVVVTVLEKMDWRGLPVDCGVTGIGMGLTHLDTVNRIVTGPVEPDSVTRAQATTAMMIAGAVGDAVLGTATMTFVTLTTASVEPGRLWPMFVLLTKGPLLTPLPARCAA